MKMKHGYLISFGVAACLITALWVNYYTLDVIKPSIDQIKGDPSLVPFIIGGLTLSPISLDLDTNKIIFSYRTIHKGQEEFFEELDESAACNGWKKEGVSPDVRIYSKLIPLNSFYLVDTENEIRYSLVNQTVIVTQRARKMIPCEGAEITTAGGTDNSLSGCEAQEVKRQ